MIYIYTLANPVTKEIRYIGKTNNCYQRYRHHLVDSANIKSHKRNWILSLKKQGLKPLMEIIDEVPTNEWKFWEEFWISQMKTWGHKLVNHTHGGEGLDSGNQTSFKKGFIPWNKTVSGYSTSKKGTTIPQDIKNKISRTLMGNTCKPKRQVKQINKETNQIINQYDSIKEASESTNIKYSSIANALTGRSKTAGGFIWL